MLSAFRHRTVHETGE